jgi:hypothetical protein
MVGKGILVRHSSAVHSLAGRFARGMLVLGETQNRLAEFTIMLPATNPVHGTR